MESNIGGNEDALRPGERAIIEGGDISVSLYADRIPKHIIDYIFAGSDELRLLGGNIDRAQVWRTPRYDALGFPAYVIRLVVVVESDARYGVEP